MRRVQVSGTVELAAKAAENTKQLAGTTGKQIAGKALSRMLSASAIDAAATAVALAPVVVGFGAACVVGSFVSDLFDDIFG
jgi:hypothetical protein